MQLVYTSIPQIVKVPVYNQIVKTFHLNLAAEAWDTKIIQSRFAI